MGTSSASYGSRAAVSAGELLRRRFHIDAVEDRGKRGEVLPAASFPPASTVAASSCTERRTPYACVPLRSSSASCASAALLESVRADSSMLLSRPRVG